MALETRSKIQSSCARDCHDSSSLRTTPVLLELGIQVIPTKPPRLPYDDPWFAFNLNSGVVAWKSSKQDTTVNSTTEAKYIVASKAAKKAVCMKNYIQELGVVFSIVEPVVIFCDNNGAIAQANEPRSHHRSKHILRSYHLLREMVGRGDIRMD
ncbi:UNVERIFIED_CONTAM: hypothetical protein Scaly_2909400 [Sesamum calycinum]|uniref:Uncharacterized protein n=1 Tax=Sesamum calycinum TaxID=2727403 RepID=A0AAW2L324_9LAMI